MVKVVSRRGLLLGSVAVAGAGAGAAALPGVRHGLREIVDPVPEPPHGVPAGGGTVVSGSFRSDAMRNVTGFGIAYPHQVQRGLGFLLVLHGRGSSHRDVFSTHHLDAFLTDAVRRGVPPYAVVGVDGGDHSYWHTRASGEDPQRMLLDEFLPVLAGRGLRTDRFALGGWSMGGYGAILLAERLGPDRVAAVVPDSPALWQRWGDSAPGAFDGTDDFASNDAIAQAGRLAGIPVRVTCGTSDPFVHSVRDFLRRVPSADRQLGPGGHDLAWWQHVAPGQLAFAGRQLDRLR